MDKLLQTSMDYLGSDVEESFYAESVAWLLGAKHWGRTLVLAVADSATSSMCPFLTAANTEICSIWDPNHQTTQFTLSDLNQS